MGQHPSGTAPQHGPTHRLWCGKVIAKLKAKSTGATFVVGTYHMPCLFGTDEKCQTMVRDADSGRDDRWFMMMLCDDADCDHDDDAAHDDAA